MELIYNKNGFKHYKLKDIKENNSRVDVYICDEKISGDCDVNIVWIPQEGIEPSQFEMLLTKEDIKEIYEATLNN